ncbi:hypothetical protein F5887DRAFT_965678 [Amanita rubescens]|nr:hypothetical protein F5887DRAFT_965678 [Amanita rubescens]
MKLLTEKQIKEHEAASLRGVLEGGAGGIAFATSIGWFLNRRWTSFRNLPFPLKVLGGVITERRGLEYDRSQWDGAIAKEEMHWQQLSGTEKLKEWALRHQYGLIFGGWAASICVAGAVIWRNKYQTPAQKIVQARMWAQGLTIGTLKADHSWAEVLEQHERERLEAAKVPQRTSLNI